MSPVIWLFAVIAAGFLGSATVVQRQHAAEIEAIAPNTGPWQSASAVAMVLVALGTFCGGLSALGIAGLA